MKQGYRVEVNIEQAGTLEELLTKLQGVKDALSALVKAKASGEDLVVGQYGAKVRATIGNSSIYEPGDLKYSYGKYCYIIDQEGKEQSIEPTEYVARLLANVVDEKIADDVEDPLTQAHYDVKVPSNDLAEVTREFIDTDNGDPGIEVRLTGHTPWVVHIVSGKACIYKTEE